MVALEAELQHAKVANLAQAQSIVATIGGQLETIASTSEKLRTYTSSLNLSGELLSELQTIKEALLYLSPRFLILGI